MTESLTISFLVLKIFFSKHYNNLSRPIPLINKPIIYNDPRLAYFGGCDEIYRPIVKGGGLLLRCKIYLLLCIFKPYNKVKS